MPRIPRGQVAGHAYHVLNRGNGGAAVFHKDGDYTAFLDLLATAKAKYPVKVFGFCLMPNHFHLVVQPATDAALSPFMQWWMTSHVRRYHRHYRSHGHVWQGRFKSFPIQQDAHLLTVLRYVLRNPVRAGLVEHAMEWPWSSLRFPHLSNPSPVEAPTEWRQWIDQPLNLRGYLSVLGPRTPKAKSFRTPKAKSFHISYVSFLEMKATHPSSRGHRSSGGAPKSRPRIYPDTSSRATAVRSAVQKTRTAAPGAIRSLLQLVFVPKSVVFEPAVARSVNRRKMKRLL